MIALYKDGLKGSYEDDRSAVDDFFEQRDPSTIAFIEEVSGPQGGRGSLLKSRFHSHSMRVSWLIYELFRWHK